MIILSILILIILFIYVELNHLLRVKSPLLLIPSKLVFNTKSDTFLSLNLDIEIKNPSDSKEYMISSFTLEPKLLGNTDFNNIRISTNIIPKHYDISSRPDHYWQTYIVKSSQSTFVNINIELLDISEKSILDELETLWIDIKWTNYGPFGLINRKDGFAISTSNIDNQFYKASETKLDIFKLIPLRTHILGILDDPIETVVKYTKSTIKSGDIITIGETPLAIMQGRYINPFNVKVSLLSRILCTKFHPTSSLATACGMQVLINDVGPSRVILSVVFGGLLKLFGIKGFFYRLAGNQARLIDDISGTTPPYDQTIVLGPKNANKFCNALYEILGCHVAVVDVNDLGRVKILTSSPGCDQSILKEALVNNPAGNADEKTPLVIVRRN